MGQNISQGLNSNNLSVLPSPAPNQTIVNVNAIAVSTSTTIYTVTTGKTFYCTGIAICNTSTTAGSVFVTVSPNTQVYEANMPAQISSAPVGAGGIIFSANSTKQIIINHALGTTHCDITIWGFEE